VREQWVASGIRIVRPDSPQVEMISTRRRPVEVRLVGQGNQLPFDPRAEEARLDIIFTESSYEEFSRLLEEDDRAFHAGKPPTESDLPRRGSEGAAWRATSLRDPIMGEPPGLISADSPAIAPSR